MSEYDESRDDETLQRLMLRYAAGTVAPAAGAWPEQPVPWAGDPSLGPASLEDLIRENPSYAEQLAAFAAAHFALVESPLDKDLDVAFKNYDMSLERTMLDAAFPASPAWGSVLECARQRGFTAGRLAQTLDLGVDVVLKLDHRLLRMASLPQLLFDRLGALLEVRIDELRAMLDTPPTLPTAAQYFSRTPPVIPPQESFADAVHAGAMTEAQRQTWLSSAGETPGVEG